ncbi:MAG: hypothetical protein IPN53_23330 [Comamonadaceae bacterium]|nr:hypothetical protein [Comamonadaceae bacterium]
MMVLGNKLQITSQAELNRVEEKLSKEKAKQLFESVNWMSDELEIRSITRLR